MRFIFRRDEEGVERIYVGDVCIAVLSQHIKGMVEIIPATVPGLKEKHVYDAIERADEAGFWDTDDGRYIWDECAVEVPVAETSTTLTLTLDGDDES